MAYAITLWNLCWPILFYGLLTDTASLIFRDLVPLACTLIGAVSATPFLWKAYKKRGNQTRKLNLTEVLLCMAGGIGGCILVNTLIRASGIARVFTGFSEISPGLYGPPLWLQVCAMGVGIPIAEELVFRGLVFGKAREDRPFFQSAVLSALLFGIYHGNVLQGMYGFSMGILFAWVMERKKTILAPVFMHMSANLLSVAVTVIQNTK